MSAWLQQVLHRGQAIADWLSPVRNEALQALSETAWPDRRTEEWKYTSLSVVEDLTLSNGNSKTNPRVECIEGVESLDLLFVDGELRTALAGLKLPVGLQISHLNHAEPLQQVIATSMFAQIKPRRHLFGLVNDVLAQDIVFINIEHGNTIAQPIRIISHSTAGHESHHRVLVRIDNQAKATIIEQLQGQGNSLSTGFTEFDVGEQAQLEHYRFVMHSKQALYFGGGHFCLHHKAKLNSTLVGYGSQLSRTDIDVIHNGEHAEAKLNAIYLLGEAEHFDLHTNIEHAKPNGKTTENVRGIVGDKANAVFNGRIHIHRNAQKALVELNNRNLLLSRRGQINTKPELEIYADDVQCAHGATVAENAEEHLYYLQARGISRSQALIMLNFGFIQELLNQMPNQHLANWLAPQLRARFKEMEVR